MADVFTEIKCTDQDFLTSARKHRRELLRRPVRRLKNSADLFSIRSGIRFEEKAGEVDDDMQFGPYNPKRTKEANPEFKFRTLKNYFGSVRREFDPNKYYKTILGSAITKGDALKSVDVARLVLNLLTSKLGDHLVRHLFDAVHNPDGETTYELFNGFDTITNTEVKAGNISADKGNLFVFPEVIDMTNAVDSIKAFCRSADDFLKEKQLNLLIPHSIYDAYLDDYQATVGALPYNTEFEKLHPEGFKNITFRPMFQKKDSEFIQLTTKDNMLIAVNQMGEEENVVVEKHDVVMLTFFATIFFGTDYESINPDRLLIGQLKKNSETV